MGAPESGMQAVEQPSAEALLTTLRTIKPTERARHVEVLDYWLSIRGGKEFPALVGQYIFADFASGIIGATPADLSEEGKVLLTTDFNIGVFGEDVDGELYAVDHFGGKIYKVVGPDCAECPEGETLCDGECTDTHQR